ncbi:MAG: (2Fe-2S) ferredoxin domain-containing protein [Natronomonas sp.]
MSVHTTSCLGLCSEGGTALTVQPKNEWYSDVRPEEVPTVLERTLGGTVSEHDIAETA